MLYPYLVLTDDTLSYIVWLVTRGPWASHFSLCHLPLGHLLLLGTPLPTSRIIRGLLRCNNLLLSKQGECQSSTTLDDNSCITILSPDRSHNHHVSELFMTWHYWIRDLLPYIYSNELWRRDHFPPSTTLSNILIALSCLSSQSPLLYSLTFFTFRLFKWIDLLNTATFFFCHLSC